MELTFTTTGDRLDVVASGPVATGDFEPALVRIFAALAEHSVCRALVDVRAVEGSYSIGDRFEFGTVLAKIHVRHVVQSGNPVRVAFLGREPVLEPGRLGETVAVNRGASVKVTTDLQEALCFLAD